MQVIGILLGVLLSGGTSLCLGIYLLRHFLNRTDRLEYLSLAFVAGSACLSQVMFFLCAAGLARKGVLLAGGLLAACAARFAMPRHQKRAQYPALPRVWKLLFGVPFLLFGLVYVVNALAPEMSPDGSAYHLPVLARSLDAHAFTPITTSLY